MYQVSRQKLERPGGDSVDLLYVDDVVSRCPGCLFSESYYKEMGSGFEAEKLEVEVMCAKISYKTPDSRWLAAQLRVGTPTSIPDISTKKKRLPEHLTDTMTLDSWVS
ncbi:hypothetical protein DSL72_004855 [Monilinia vaccinii-corymbosi]|uniref:Uncharacterized protein n=1 Tax=Monilinia vaccinii-corymbosi TaxID=61207 RepID=A0A8A3NXT8_9HELO|nr:hypothetical protein DSL72_004855 [Monilinia vaccinii-corymbosi]